MLQQQSQQMQQQSQQIQQQSQQLQQQLHQVEQLRQDLRMAHEHHAQQLEQMRQDHKQQMEQLQQQHAQEMERLRHDNTALSDQLERMRRDIDTDSKRKRGPGRPPKVVAENGKAMGHEQPDTCTDTPLVSTRSATSSVSHA
jgi:septal ring factor EnvC (AmiA/AmiB activator)